MDVSLLIASSFPPVIIHGLTLFCTAYHDVNGKVRAKHIGLVEDANSSLIGRQSSLDLLFIQQTPYDC